jgi:hypothetical protein
MSTESLASFDCQIPSSPPPLPVSLPVSNYSPKSFASSSTTETSKMRKRFRFKFNFPGVSFGKQIEMAAAKMLSKKKQDTQSDVLVDKGDCDQTSSRQQQYSNVFMAPFNSLAKNFAESKIVKKIKQNPFVSKSQDST